jgi:hypothetical protein
MKIILDESVPQNLRLLVEGGHTVATAWYQGWSGLKNGALLDAAEAAGFDLFITADQEMSYQQNLTVRKMALVVLSSNNWKRHQGGYRHDLGRDQLSQAGQLCRSEDFLWLSPTVSRREAAPAQMVRVFRGLVPVVTVDGSTTRGALIR